MTQYKSSARGRGLHRGAALLAVGLTASLLGCGNLLNVDNPNLIKAEATKDPVAATALANGALAAVTYGYGYTLAPYSTATDELDWSGSRDAWRSLDQGTITDPYNEFSDAAYPQMARARWLADYAITTLDSLRSAGVLGDTTDLARAYLYGAMAYVAIADMYDNFVFSNLDTAGVPIGHDQMGALYDDAVGYADAGLAIPQIDDELQIALTAMKARAQFDHAIWNHTEARPVVMGLVDAGDGATAAATATTALSLMSAAGESDWKFQFEYSSTSESNYYAQQVNDRQEMRLGHAYVLPDPKKPTWQDSTVLLDPVDSIPSPVIDAYQKAFKGQLFASATFLSAREMHLILAEAALAGADSSTFQTEINTIRSMNGLTDWSTGTGISATAILEYERRVNLFGQGRRLQDEYRFGDYPDLWQPGSEARTTPGRLLPITTVECLSNDNIGADKCGTLDP